MEAILIYFFAKLIAPLYDYILPRVKCNLLMLSVVEADPLLMRKNIFLP